MPNTLDERRFRKCCGLTYKEIMSDLEMVVDLTGFESQTELDMLHESIYHSEDHDIEDEPYLTPAQLSKQYHIEKANYGTESCQYCPPYEGDNAGLGNTKHKGKRGTQKKMKVNKKQGRAVKRSLAEPLAQATYDSNNPEHYQEFKKNLGKTRK